MNLLTNPNFAGNWTRKTHTGQEYGEIFVPEGWVAFWKEGRPVPHDPGNPIGYGRPEMHVINKEPPFLDPPRVYEGTRAFKLFTFYRIHMAGIYQTVSGIRPGQKVRASGFAHAWSSGGDNARYSDGAGESALAVKAIDYDKTDGVRNFTFSVGIDPKGGADPWSSDVIWGEGIHIYNAYAGIPAVEVTAQAEKVTVFVRSAVLWPFKHCDAYLDKMSLEVTGDGSDTEPDITATPISLSVQPDEIVQGEVFKLFAEGGLGPRDLRLRMDHEALYTQGRRITGDKAYWKCVYVDQGDVRLSVTDDAGNSEFVVVNITAAPEPEPSQPDPVPDATGFMPPREDYERTYLLLPPDAGDAWLQAVVESGVWRRNRWTIGGSADDAGIGPTQRRIIAVNPHKWPSTLQVFFDDNYAGADFIPITASTPADLRRALESM